MGLFRLGKLALAGDKDKQEEAPSAGLLSAAVTQQLLDLRQLFAHVLDGREWHPWGPRS